MKSPKVSFVIPCYKLGHLLPECVNSILAQTYTDFEILIMDDCSPDNTQEVATQFSDRRVRYIRNEQNLGHLRNYNKGIELSRGKYVWLISADDYLRRTYVLERYVQLMEAHPTVGYTFCPGIGVKDGNETGVLAYSVLPRGDGIIPGREFLDKLVEQNIVIAGSVLARRDCYNISLFPLDSAWAGKPVEMGWAGDWYLWCIFALSFDVAYFAEPMVCYREHDLNMTAIITDREKVSRCAAADIAIPWMIKCESEKHGFHSLSKKCLNVVAGEYAKQARSKTYRSAETLMTPEEFERSLCASTESEAERTLIRARFLEGVADRFWQLGIRRAALKGYWAAVRLDPRLYKIYPKLLLVPFGRFGNRVRDSLGTLHVFGKTAIG
jgi:glycosyltransferase involved in cell wall biosynthesis